MKLQPASPPVNPATPPLVLLPVSSDWLTERLIAPLIAAFAAQKYEQFQTGDNNETTVFRIVGAGRVYISQTNFQNWKSDLCEALVAYGKITGEDMLAWIVRNDPEILQQLTQLTQAVTPPAEDPARDE